MEPPNWLGIQTSLLHILSIFILLWFILTPRPDGLPHTVTPFLAISCSLPRLSLHPLCFVLCFDSATADSAGSADSSPREVATRVGALKLPPVSTHTGEQTLVDNTNRRKLWAGAQSGLLTALSPFSIWNNNKLSNVGKVLCNRTILKLYLFKHTHNTYTHKYLLFICLSASGASRLNT